MDSNRIDAPFMPLVWQLVGLQGRYLTSQGTHCTRSHIKGPKGKTKIRVVLHAFVSADGYVCLESTAPSNDCHNLFEQFKNRPIVQCAIVGLYFSAVFLAALAREHRAATMYIKGRADICGTADTSLFQMGEGTSQASPDVDCFPVASLCRGRCFSCVCRGRHSKQFPLFSSLFVPCALQCVPQADKLCTHSAHSPNAVVCFRELETVRF